MWLYQSCSIGNLRFYNFYISLGGTIDCSAHGVPAPKISWHTMGHLTGNLNPSWKPLKRNQAQTYNPSISSPALHHVLQHNNSLHFRAFSTSEFDPNIHDSFYRCMATSESGVALSRRVRVRAGDVFHFYKIQIFWRIRFFTLLYNRNFSL